MAFALMAVSVPVSASSNIVISNSIMSEASGLIGMAISDPNSSFSNGSYSIGDEIPSYVLDAGNISDFVDAEYYPIYRDGDPVAIFSVNDASSSAPTYILGEDFIDELGEFLSDTNESYSLIVSDYQIFAFADGQASELARFEPGTIELNEEASGITTYSNGGSLDFVDESEIIDAVSDGQELETADIEAQVTLQLPRQTRAFRQIDYLPNAIPKAVQPSGSYACWAYSAWFIGECLTDYGYDPIDDCIPAGNGEYGKPGKRTQTRDVLINLYDLPAVSYGSKLSVTQMKNLINSDEPFSMSCFEGGVMDDGVIGHAVSAYGYDDSYTPIRIAVMDSLVSSESACLRYMTSPSTGTDYKITSGGITYVYCATAAPYGV